MYPKALQLTFHCVELNRKTTRVASFVRELASRGDGRESNEDRSLLTDTR
jgi:hypothetical protein